MRSLRQRRMCWVSEKQLPRDEQNDHRNNHHHSFTESTNSRPVDLLLVVLFWIWLRMNENGRKVSFHYNRCCFLRLFSHFQMVLTRLHHLGVWDTFYQLVISKSRSTLCPVSYTYCLQKTLYNTKYV